MDIAHSCGTCVHCSRRASGGFNCDRFNSGPIPDDFYKVGCDCHIIRPDLMPFPLVPELCTLSYAVYQTDQGFLQNGEPCGNVFSSREIIENGAEVCLTPLVIEARDLFDAIIEGTKDA